MTTAALLTLFLATGDLTAAKRMLCLCAAEDCFEPQARNEAVWLGGEMVVVAESIHCRRHAGRNFGGFADATFHPHGGDYRSGAVRVALPAGMCGGSAGDGDVAAVRRGFAAVGRKNKGCPDP